MAAITASSTAAAAAARSTLSRKFSLNSEISRLVVRSKTLAEKALFLLRVRFYERGTLRLKAPHVERIQAPTRIEVIFLLKLSQASLGPSAEVAVWMRAEPSAKPKDRQVVKPRQISRRWRRFNGIAIRFPLGNGPPVQQLPPARRRFLHFYDAPIGPC